ncbi:hypothetical protein [Spiroplasma endosymbiont of Labia minor]|uniref:hypothetical protein n=1 Tax=Spiroplasma endosymbiont of Labia minor TaxID=3066305 RepID=UPI0030D51FB6
MKRILTSILSFLIVGAFSANAISCSNTAKIIDWKEYLKKENFNGIDFEYNRTESINQETILEDIINGNENNNSNLFMQEFLKKLPANLSSQYLSSGEYGLFSLPDKENLYHGRITIYINATIDFAIDFNFTLQDSIISSTDDEILTSWLSENYLLFSEKWSDEAWKKAFPQTNFENELNKILDFNNENLSSKFTFSSGISITSDNTNFENNILSAISILILFNNKSFAWPLRYDLSSINADSFNDINSTDENEVINKLFTLCSQKVSVDNYFVNDNFKYNLETKKITIKQDYIYMENNNYEIQLN